MSNHNQEKLRDAAQIIRAPKKAKIIAIQEHAGQLYVAAEDGLYVLRNQKLDPVLFCSPFDELAQTFGQQS